MPLIFSKGVKWLKFKDKLGLEFIEASMPFIPTEHLYTIRNMAEEGYIQPQECERIMQIVDDQLEKRKTGKLYKAFSKGKEVWIKK